MLILVALVSPLTSRHAVALLVAGAVAAAATVRAARRAERRPGDRGARTALVAAAAALTAVVAVEQTVTAVVVDQRRSLRFGTSPAWNAAHERRAKAIRSADAFPRYRTVSGRPGFTANDPLLLGAQGAAYYSSVLPLGTSRTLIALGFPYDLRSTQGRHVLDADSPVLDAIFAVGARATAGRGTRPVGDAAAGDAPARRANARAGHRPVPRPGGRAGLRGLPVPGGPVVPRPAARHRWRRPGARRRSPRTTTGAPAMRPW
ncbi:YfhO family protein [Actinomadura madurae]|uniref:YfhO family protein n=1 Tax=Actinomadura madurae TaxID=1993 RepID=UPI0020D2236F|nr:YfhO family protein [Actinomadura madurae]MCP9966944.1 YfhO family protein [Actinomadura madurae]